MDLLHAEARPEGCLHGAMAWLDSAPLVALEISLEGSILSANAHAQQLLLGSDVKALGLSEALQRALVQPELLQATLPTVKGPVPLLLQLWRDDQVVRLVGHDVAPLQRLALAQELRAPLHGMVGLAQALAKMPALAAPVKKQRLRRAI